MKCKRCGEQTYTEEHHTHPRFMSNIDGKGSKVNLCRKCHMELHLRIPAIIWRNIGVEKIRKIVDEVVKYTKWFCTAEKTLKDININKKHGDFCDNCKYELDEEDILDRSCPNCFTSILNKIEDILESDTKTTTQP